MNLPDPQGTDRMMARDSALLGEVLKIRFYPLSVVKAQDCILIDSDGQEYLDFVAGGAVVNAGHNVPEVVAAAVAQFQTASFSPLWLGPNEPALELADQLIDLLPGDFEKKAWFGLHGSDANDTLAKLAPLASGRRRLVSYIGGYHGQTGASAALSGHTAQARYIGQGNVVKVPYPYPYRCPFGACTQRGCSLQCLDYVENYIFRTICPPEDTAAIIIEAIQSDGGEIVPPENYLPSLEKMCNRHGIMLFLDEVKLGLGRTGKMFGFQHSGVTPDAVSLGKPLGSGVAAISAVIGRSEILDIAPAMNLYTMAGNPVSCAVGSASLASIASRRLLEQATSVGAYLLHCLQDLAQRHPLIGDVRGVGMIIGVELVRDRSTKEPADSEAAKVVFRCKQLGLILIYCGIYSNVIEITPPLTLTAKQADSGLAIIDTALADVEGGRISDEALGSYAGW